MGGGGGGWTRTGHKVFKKEGQAGSRSGFLKGGLEPAYELCPQKRLKLATFQLLIKGSRKAEAVSEGPEVLHICFCSLSNNFM